MAFEERNGRREGGEKSEERSPMDKYGDINLLSSVDTAIFQRVAN